MKATNPINGEMIDTSKQIVTFGITEKETQRILDNSPVGFKMCNCESYTDIMAFQGCISFINPETLNDQDLSKIIEFYSEVAEYENYGGMCNE